MGEDKQHKTANDIPAQTPIGHERSGAISRILLRIVAGWNEATGASMTDAEQSSEANDVHDHRDPFEQREKNG